MSSLPYLLCQQLAAVYKFTLEIDDTEVILRRNPKTVVYTSDAYL